MWTDETPQETMLNMAMHEIKTLTQTVADLRAERERLSAALQFYADKKHFMLSDPSAWDTVTGEPSNFWCDAGSATVEDGTIAKLTLAGKSVFDDERQQQDIALASPPAPEEPATALFGHPPAGSYLTDCDMDEDESR